MEPLRAVGVLLTVLGLAGYVAGIFVAYPGRAFSILGVMVGVTVATVGGEYE